MEDLPSQDNFDSHIVARAIAAQFSELAEVDAVALGGSRGTGRADAYSDIDLYIFCRSVIPVEARARIIEPRACRMELDNEFWGETEDYWIETESKTKVEAVYKGEWVVENLSDMFANNCARLGFSTTIWHSVKTSEVLYDRDGWFASLHKIADVPYPDALAEAIIRKNFVVLRGSLAALPTQLAQAVNRNDDVSTYHFVGVILDSYFDILFALNRTPHPGTKRMLAYTENLEHQPEGMHDDVTDLVNHCDPAQVVGKVDRLIDRLAALLLERNAL
jgi:predicted nucleotidyltransferase